MTTENPFGPSQPELIVIVAAGVAQSAQEPSECRAALSEALEGVEHWDLVVVDEDDPRSVGEVLATVGSPTSALVVLPGVRLARGAAVALLSALERPGVGVVVPRVQDEWGSIVRTIHKGRTRLEQAADYECERPVEAVEAIAMLLSGALLDVFRRTGEMLWAADSPGVLGARVRAAGFLTWFTPATTALVSEADPERRPAPWICFAANDWWYHNQAHSEFQLMRRVARRRQVLLVNSIGMRMPLPGRSTRALRRVLLKLGSILRFVRRPLPDTPDFNVATPFTLPLYGSPVGRRLNTWLVLGQVRLMARRLGIDVHQSVIVVTIPTAWEVVKHLQPRAVLLNRSDLHSAFGETDQAYIRHLEDELLEQADVVLYVSHALMAAELDQVGQRGHFLDHGLDLDRFGGDIAAEPDDLAAIPHPRVGFFGGLDDYLVDFDLLERLARENPDLSVVLIGDATVSMARFDQLPNVHWLGFKPAAEIPSYGAGFDVALMPWLQNEWIQNSNPIKLKEYLALGLPIVSTDFPEAHHYEDVVSIAGDSDGFVKLVNDVLRGKEVGTPSSRRARVAGASWDHQADELVAIGEGVRR